MFIRPCYKLKNGKRHAYWALVESYRTARGPRQRVVSYLGQLKEAQRLGLKQAGGGKCQSPFKQLQFFDADNKPQPEWVEVDTANVSVENELDFGGPWLALQLIYKLKLDVLFEGLMPPGKEDVPWSKMALVLIICRLCHPSSELHIAEHYYRSTAMPELLGIPSRKIYDERLYRSLDKLLRHKEALEKHLKEQLGELFGLKYDLLLYDVTSTYFEGQCLGNPMAKHGYSRDKRSDCKQVCIGLVVSQCGMPLGYEVFEGNRNDVKTWQEIVTTMESRYGNADRIWCGDRGISMHQRFEQRIDVALKKLKTSCQKRRYKKETIDRRVGSIMAKNSRAAGLFEVQPVWHQNEERVLAHILVCFLSYVLWKTLHQMTKAAGLGDEPRRIFEELDKISLVDVILPTGKGVNIRRRCVRKPSEHQAILLSRLGLNLPSQITS